MKGKLVYTVADTPGFPDFSALLSRLGLEEQRHGSQRKAISAVKKQAPDFLIAEFIYGYGNNYAGINISNLDVLLYTLQRYAPRTRVIVLAERSEIPLTDKLRDIFPLHAVVPNPVGEAQLEALFT